MVWAVPRSLAATRGITDLFYFLPGTKMFQFPDLPPRTLCIQVRVTRHYSSGVAPFGDPRMEGCNAYPRIFAVYYVLLRLLAPRYPPCALSSLDLNSAGSLPVRSACALLQVCSTSNPMANRGVRTSPDVLNLILFLYEIQTFLLCSFQGTGVEFAAPTSRRV
jgi:hypothetical protein